MSESSQVPATPSVRPGSEQRITHYANDERYRALIEATSQAVWSWAADGESTDFERSRQWWEELTGQSIAEQLESDVAWLDVVHSEDRHAAGECWANALSTGINYDNHFRVRGRQGGWRHVRARGIPIRDAEGTVREWIGTLDDVTAQRDTGAEYARLLAEADAERRRLEEVFRHAPSFMAVLRGPEHIFERVNDRYVQLIGGRNVVGRTVREALPEVTGQGYFELLDQVYQTGTPHVAVEAQIVLHNSPAPSEHTLQFVYQPMFDASGTVTGVIVQGIDLTEQRHAEAGLARVTAESERQRRMYETALSNTADFVYLFDKEGRFTFVNKALLNLWGKDLSQAVGRNFFDLDYPPELATRLQRQIQDVIRTGRTLRDETPYTSSSGAETYEYIFVPVFGIDGTVEAVAGSTRNITERKRSENILRVSEERHRALVTATSDVVYRMSADWTEMQPVDGRDFVTSSTKPVRDWMQINIPQFEHDRVNRAIQTAIATQQPFELEHQVIRVDGTLGWTFSRAVPIFNHEGSITEWFGMASDVSRRRQAEEDLSDIRSRMEAALAAGAIGTWNWDIQSDRFYGDVSLAKLFSVEQNDVHGGKISRILEAIHPADRKRIEAEIQQSIISGKHYEAEYRVSQSDGSWKWVTARGLIERDEAGHAVRFPGVVIDVTDWKRAKEELARITEESDRRKRVYETILSNSPDFAYVFNLEHRFVYANETLLRMWGRTWDEAIGKSLLELGYEPWHAEMHNREIDEVKRTGKAIRGEVPFRGTFGHRIYDYIFVPVFGADGTVEVVVGTTRDVTDRKASEEALRDADRKKDNFLAILAHELRNPLAPIRNGLHVMRLAETNREAVAVAREVMERQLAHMVRLIDDLLDVSRITRNKMELRRSRVTLADVVASAVETAGPAIQDAQHELIIDLPVEPLILDVDLTRLAQVFSNLLTNSAKYTLPGGKIWLTALRNSDQAIISVRDTGIGIPRQALLKIFDMFSQVDRSIERSTGGLGIGLALVKGLVEMHDGSVTAESVEGQGSTFTVQLKLSEPVTPDSKTADSALNQPNPSRRVLVVDDNRDGADSMALMLQLLGNQVTTAHDGQQAVAVAESFQPDIILMDIGLPLLNGLDATRQIRAQPWGKKITILALTGWGQDYDRELSRNAGCDGHLVKPVNPTDLVNMLEKHQSEKTY